ncbi:MAG: aminotransferase class I/II-fold pyridoxal phosphate-dependent enzyme, partial [Bordetella sp.]|nr:aminotransferase class I/II-fold pyridoxal phosphate-dependent enzyme [Bordetella sp.]
MSTSATPAEKPVLRRASRIAKIEVSEILRIGARAAQLKRDGRDVIVLGAGEPDFDTPDNVKQAAVRAIEAGETKYTLLDGTIALKTAIAGKFKRENGLDFGLDQITASAGAKQVIHNALMATLDAGDEVIVVTPYWTSYADMITIAGGTTVQVDAREENGFLLDPADLERAITPRTRWLMLNSPSNPSGAAYDEARLRAIADVL